MVAGDVPQNRGENVLMRFMADAPNQNPPWFHKKPPPLATNLYKVISEAAYVAGDTYSK